MSKILNAKNDNDQNNIISNLQSKIKERKTIFFLILLFTLNILIYATKYIKNKIYFNIIRNEFKPFVKKYEYLLNKKKKIPKDSPIWIMWYDGIKSAPPIIKACIQSIIKNRVEHPVYILDKNNLHKYIKLPEYILQKLNKEIFSITHFSDIVRMALLSKYGGYWIDSTYFVNTPLIYNNYSLFTLKLSQCYKGTITKCRWAGNFLAMPKKSFLSSYVYNSFLFYWKK